MKIAPSRVPLRQPRADKHRPPARFCSRPADKSSPLSPLPPRLHCIHHAVPMAFPQTCSSRPPVTSAHVQERQCRKGLPLALVKRAVNRDLCLVNASRGGMLETHIFVRRVVDRLQCLTVSQHLTAPVVRIHVVRHVGVNQLVSDRLLHGTGSIRFASGIHRILPPLPLMQVTIIVCSWSDLTITANNVGRYHSALLGNHPTELRVVIARSSILSRNFRICAQGQDGGMCRSSSVDATAKPQMDGTRAPL